MTAQKADWQQVYKGGHRKAKQIAKEYRARGYFARVRNHTTHATVEVSEATPYKRYPHRKV